MPFRSASFDLLTCTYAFANLRDSLSVLREFARVTRAGGRIALIDVIAPENPERREELNRLESQRGHLYTRLLPRWEFLALFAQSELRIVNTRSRRRLCHFREWVRLSPAAAHHPKQALRLRNLLIDTIEGDKARVHARRSRDDIVFYHTTAWFLLEHA
jgi:SAM-dependent methyltransferase